MFFTAQIIKITIPKRLPSKCQQTAVVRTAGTRHLAPITSINWLRYLVSIGKSFTQFGEKSTNLRKENDVLHCHKIIRKHINSKKGIHSRSHIYYLQYILIKIIKVLTYYKADNVDDH